ncbi:MAG TPA: Trk system potassium transporter TrkA [Acidimicrobiaceae bacterium]|nr:Trk system potassium transporter TrkA [Acidimicrobiaceae bacterium]
MRILVIGAGEVGTYIAGRLSREGHDIVVVDHRREALDALGSQHDALTVLGNGTSPHVLEEAGLERAELMVAVTDRDEVNLIACMQAKRCGGIKTVARIEDSGLRGRAGRALLDEIGVDLVLDPEGQTAEAIHDLLVYPGATEVYELAGGEVLVLGVRLSEDALVVGRTAVDIGTDYEPDWDFIFGALTRNGETTVMRRDVTLQPGDLLRVVCRRRGRAELMRITGLRRTTLRRVMLLGGPRTAERLGQRLTERGTEVTIIERDEARCLELAKSNRHAKVMHGDITDIDVLESEGVGGFDAVVAGTGEDDANVLACLYAKSQGAGETVAVVHRLRLLPLLKDVGIDAALSPRTASANGVLQMVRGGVTSVGTFLEGDVEVLELEVSPDSRADGKQVRDLHLPGQMLLAAVSRDGNAHIARGHTQLRARDHVVAFVTPDQAGEVKRAFD